MHFSPSQRKKQLFYIYIYVFYIALKQRWSDTFFSS